jgi:hypothetical protein
MVTNMTEFQLPNANSKYSAHGSHLIGKLRVYHQGGLDTYCGFYAILNLINFLKFKERHTNHDFIGAEEFNQLNLFIETGAFHGFFPRTPLGNEGLDTPMLIGALALALSHFNLRSRIIIEDDQSVDPADKSKHDRWFRYGAEKPFVSPNCPDDVLGVAAVMEDEDDELQHWVVFVGKNHLKNTRIDCESDWNGIVLDSERGYERWRVGTDNKLPRISIRRNAKAAIPVHWISSFVSVAVN